MASTTHITCPNCGSAIDIEELLAHDIEERVRREQQRSFDKERDRLLREAEDRVTRELQATIESLRHENAERKRETEALRALEVAHLDLQRTMREQQESFELAVQKRILEEQTALEMRIRKAETERFDVERRREAERHDLEKRELVKKLEDTQRAAEELRRKADQSSQQLQGEVQELALEEFLRSAYPSDEIVPVEKGQRGADCVQKVSVGGRACGAIMYESKRTKHFSAEWIDKLKANMRATGADIGVIVTETMPKEHPAFAQISGVWVCTFSEVRSLVAVLREMLIRVSTAVSSQENKGEKMAMLYDYLMSSEFRMSVENVMESFLQMRQDLAKERVAMERMWKQRERQLERMSLSMSGVMGSISGIAGKDLGPVPTFELPGADEPTPLA
jgi:hypothetical protein